MQLKSTVALWTKYRALIKKTWDQNIFVSCSIESWDSWARSSWFKGCVILFHVRRKSVTCLTGDIVLAFYVERRQIREKREKATGAWFETSLSSAMMLNIACVHSDYSHTIHVIRKVYLERASLFFYLELSRFLFFNLGLSL